MTDASINKHLEELRKNHAYRSRQLLESPQGVEVNLDGRPYVSFCSNDYLGLANDPRVCRAANNAINQYGVGSGASQLISGYSNLHYQLEEQLADFFGYSRCLLFSSGYLANLGTISTFANKNSVIVEDKLNHASLIDAARYANAKLKRYKHCDSEHAEKIIQQHNQANLLVTDGVFSMEGSIAPLYQLVKIASKNQCKLIVDDAHGIGVLGKYGKGSLEYENVQSSQVDILIGTFGKSFGSSGAFVLSNEENISYLIQKARTLIYTTAAPVALAAAALQSLNIITNEPERREKLNNNIAYFRHCAKQVSLNLLNSVSAIQSLVIGSNNLALLYSKELKRHGLMISAIRPPTVPKNTSRLRITLCSEHTHQHIDQLIATLIKIGKTI